MKHKQYIVEWGGVSSEVIKASSRLVKAIWNHSKESSVYYDYDGGVPYLQGEFEFDFSSVGLDVDIPFRITYTIYVVDNLKEYNALFADVNGDESANSSSDLETHRINIVSGLIGGYQSPDFFSNIMHEVDHIFEYLKGYKKNDTLYDKVINGINSNDEYVKGVSMLMYYCFKHEQDAFVHGFYGALVQNKYDGDFEHAIYNFSEYSNLINIKLTVLHKFDRNEVKRACNELGTSFEHVSRFSAYIVNKMKNKLFKAYTRYCIQDKKRLIGEIIQQNKMKPFMFNEYQKRYKDLIIQKPKYIDKL